MNASMKRPFACTSVTVLAGTCSSPGSRNSGAISINRSDIGRGKPRMRDEVVVLGAGLRERAGRRTGRAGIQLAQQLGDVRRRLGLEDDGRDAEHPVEMRECCLAQLLPELLAAALPMVVVPDEESAHRLVRVPPPG